VAAVGLIASAWGQKDFNRSLCESRESHWHLGDQKYLYSVLAKDLADQVYRLSMKKEPSNNFFIGINIIFLFHVLEADNSSH
jgi:hypothetical protein